MTMRKCTSYFPTRLAPASCRKVAVFALGVMTISLGYIIYNQKDPHLLTKDFRENHTCEMYGNNVKWVNFSNDIFMLYVYSAFYDDRPSLLSDPVIKLISMSDPFVNLSVTQLYCILHYGSNTVVLLMIDEPSAYDTMFKLNKRRALRYVYTCPSVKNIIPNAVAISTNRDANSSACITVTVPHKPEKQREICICPHAAYGLTLDPYRLIEWMELQKILGVSLVGVYVLSASAPVQDVFRHYAAEGFVELREMNYIYASVNTDTEEEFFFHMITAINDCMYRHMYEFRRIAVMDFDEIIMPRYQENLSAMITYLDANETTRNVNYFFRNNFFFLNLPPDDTISPYLTVLRFRRKMALSPDGYAPKSIINPQSCAIMHHHFCEISTANFSVFGTRGGSVNPEIALLHHYKKCHFSKDTCQTMLSRPNSTQDDVMLRWNDTLTKNVRDKIKTITGNKV